MFNTICWILIGICCFYILRNVWAGLLYQITDMNVQATIKLVGYNKVYNFKDLMPRRNYYLFVLNPLWWRISDVFKEKRTRLKIREYMKNLRRIK